VDGVTLEGPVDEPAGGKVKTSLAGPAGDGPNIVTLARHAVLSAGCPASVTNERPKRRSERSAAQRQEREV
jgi:hypothetical protein